MPLEPETWPSSVLPVKLIERLCGREIDIFIVAYCAPLHALGSAYMTVDEVCLDAGVGSTSAFDAAWVFAPTNI